MSVKQLLRSQGAKDYTMKTTMIPFSWLALNFLWYLLVGFLLAYTPSWAQAIVLPFAFALTLAKLLMLPPVITWTLSSGLAGGLANAFVGSVFGIPEGQLATAFAMVVFLAWTVPGFASLAIASIISVAAAFLWAKTMSLSSILGSAGMGAIAGILAMTLPEAIAGARNDLIKLFGKPNTFLILSSVSLVGLALGRWGKQLFSSTF
ncbi:hypothetical protein H6F76_16200 [Leptolyngbya sp. FACHB-321]|uniref:hypothetical protein n=1 Tax=Leptolyngbya sp. FACHB-321 TaxID=2692807 RepID=UPI0016875984|nr:hypothetical protein [Leptolyngbya sp. FACHB-321]MBD2036555.1 hypothetical protein [Leptolyngbya sp. FACHB-321]